MKIINLNGRYRCVRLSLGWYVQHNGITYWGTSLEEALEQATDLGDINPNDTGNDHQTQDQSNIQEPT